MSATGTLGKFLAAVVLLLLVLSVNVVTERERAIKLWLGKVVEADVQPGLLLIVPFFHSLHKFDARILTIDANPERFLTKEKKALLVDSFIKWRISEDGVADYYTSTYGGDERRAQSLVAEIINKRLRDEFGVRTIQEVVSGEREQVMRKLVIDSNKETANLGIEVIDVRVKRIDLPEEVSHSVYLRMETARLRIAKELRSQGEEEAERIRAEADKERTVILAEAYRDAEKTRGEGDAVAAATYAKAFNKNPEFYAFTRSLKAYRNTFDNKGNLLIVEPDSEFFKYFKKARGM